MKPCGNPECRRLHTNDKYCSKRCTAIVTRQGQSVEKRREIAGAGRMKQIRGEVFRMVQRVKYYGRTEDERIVLAWRYGRQAMFQSRYRQRKAS